jgi:hypothetical protein
MCYPGASGALFACGSMVLADLLWAVFPPAIEKERTA